MAKNSVSNLDFLGYHQTMVQCEELKQQPSVVVSSHDKDKVTYKELHQVLNMVGKDLSVYQNSVTGTVSGLLDSFTQILISKDIATPEEIKSLLSKLTKQTEDRVNYSKDNKGDNGNDKK